MRITYDPAKNATNIERRKLPFDLIAELDWSTAVIVEDVRRDYGERRYRVFGYIGDRLYAPYSRHAAMPSMSSACGKPTAERSNIMAERRKQSTSIDDENPEWTAEDFARARPASEVLPKLVGTAAAAEMLRPKRGRPVSANPKAHVNLRLDPDVVAAFRATGRGWQTRLNAALKDWLKDHSPA